MAELLHELLERNSRKYPYDKALIWPDNDVRLTWLELNKRANNVAHYLHNKGLGKGDNAALLISNRPEFVIGFFGILKAGLSVVPVNVRLTPTEISYILNNSNAKVIIYEPELKKVAVNASEKTTLISFSEIENKENIANLSLDILPDDIAEIIYTSGTTGKPKGVVLSHKAAYLAGNMMAYEGEIKYKDRVLHLMPLTHSAPLNLFMIGAVYAGACNVVGTYHPQTLLEYVHREKTTHFFGAPVAYTLAAKLPNFEKYNLNSMKLWVYGGAGVSGEVVNQLISKFKGSFMSVYGSTEAGPNGTALHPYEHPDYAGSIGRQGVVNSEIKIVDDETNEVSTGQIGEIAIKSPTLMIEYYNNSAATEEVMKNGWLLSGDMALQDEEGYIWIKDRKKDMIVTGGINVYPKEVEDILISHYQIADVAVIGIPHPEWGETPTAVVIPAEKESPPTLDNIRKFCKDKLADYKIPRKIIYSDNIPRSATGKTLKHILKEQHGG